MHGTAVRSAIIAGSESAKKDVKEDTRAKRKRARWRLRFKCEASSVSAEEEADADQQDAGPGPGDFCIHIVDLPAATEAAKPQTNSLASDISCAIANYFVSSDFVKKLPQSSFEKRSIAVVGRDGVAAGLAMAMLGARVVFFGDPQNAMQLRMNVNAYLKETPDYTGKKSQHVFIHSDPSSRYCAPDYADLCEILGLPPPLDLIIVADGPQILGCPDLVENAPSDNKRPATSDATPRDRLAYSRGMSTSSGSVRPATDATQPSGASREEHEWRFRVLMKNLVTAVPKNAPTSVLYIRHAPVPDVEPKDARTSSKLRQSQPHQTPHAKMLSEFPRDDRSVPIGPSAHWFSRFFCSLSSSLDMHMIERVERPIDGHGPRVSTAPSKLGGGPVILGGRQRSIFLNSGALFGGSLVGMTGELPRLTMAPLSKIASKSCPLRPGQLSKKVPVDSVALRKFNYDGAGPNQDVEEPSARRYAVPFTASARRDALRAALWQGNQEMKARQDDLARQTSGWSTLKESSMYTLQEQHQQMMGVRETELQELAGCDLPRMNPGIGSLDLPPSGTLRDGDLMPFNVLVPSPPASRPTTSGVSSSPRAARGTSSPRRLRKVRPRRSPLRAKRCGYTGTMGSNTNTASTATLATTASTAALASSESTAALASCASTAALASCPSASSIAEFPALEAAAAESHKMQHWV